MGTPSLGTRIFWMVALGLVIGYIAFFVYRKRGIKLIASILTGTAGAVVVGLLAIVLNLPSPLSYAIVGAIICLFAVNAFAPKYEALFGPSEDT